MKNLNDYIIEKFKINSNNIEHKSILNNEQIKHLDDIIRHNNVDVDKPFFFMTRIPKKKEFHIYQCQDREELEEYFLKTIKEPLEFGRYSLINNDKEELLKKTKLWTFRKEHYKIIEKK